MRTKTTKEAELLQFEKLPDMFIIRAAIRTLYRRHHEGFNLIFCLSLGLVFGFVIGRLG